MVLAQVVAVHSNDNNRSIYKTSSPRSSPSPSSLSHHHHQRSESPSSSSLSDYHDHDHDRHHDHDHYRATATSASRQRLWLLRLLLETACCFLHSPSGGASDVAHDLAADSEASTMVAAMGREALVAAGMGEAVVLVVDGLLAMTQTTTTMTVDDAREIGNHPNYNNDNDHNNSGNAPVPLLALCCHVVALLAGPSLPSGSASATTSSSSRFLYPPSAASNHLPHHIYDNEEGPSDDEGEGGTQEASSASTNLAPTLSSLGLLVVTATSTPATHASHHWPGMPSGHRMGLEPFSTRLFQIDLRKTLSLQAGTGTGSGAVTAYRLRASGCCETIVQVMD